MDTKFGESRFNGKLIGAVEASGDPVVPRLGAGNRAVGAPAPVAVLPPAQFGETDPLQEQATPEADRQQEPRKQEEKTGEDPQQHDSDGEGQDEKSDPSKAKESQHKEPARPPFYKRPLLMAVLIGVILILAIGGILYWLHARQYEGTDDAFIEGHVTPISPRVAAQVQDVDVDDNYYVTKGQLLAQLDPRDFQAALNQAKANEASMRGQLAQAQSNLTVSQATVEEAQAELTVAQVNFENADLNYKRYLALDSRATSRQQLDNVTAEERGNQAQVEQAKAKVTQAQAQVASAQSQIQIAQANVDRAAADVQTAALNLSYCTITSPQDGYITRKNVEPGSYVQVGQVLFSTVPKNVWVVANFKETQLDLMRPGQPVDVHVDAYPDKTFHGKVDSIEAGTGARFSLLPPENATGNYVKVVQRVPVKIVLDPGETNDAQHILGVGMSAEPEVKVR